MKSMIAFIAAFAMTGIASANTGLQFKCYPSPTNGLNIHTLTLQFQEEGQPALMNVEYKDRAAIANSPVDYSATIATFSISPRDASHPRMYIENQGRGWIAYVKQNGVEGFSQLLCYE